MARKYIRYVTEEKYQLVSDENKQLIKKYFNFKNMNLSESTKNLIVMILNNGFILFMSNIKMEL